MSNQVLVDRSVLAGLVWYADSLLGEVNHLARYTGSTGDDAVHDDADYAAAVELLTAPAPIPDAGEGVEVAAYLNEWMTRDGGGMRVRPALSRGSEEWLKREYGPSAKVVKSEPLMTVAQHNRIVSALQASAMVVPGGWIAVSDRLPEVMEGEEQEVIVCVKRAHNGESYVFSARYLNAFLLYNDDIDDESTTATGWHDVKEHSEYDGWYSKLIDDGSGDEVTHWMPLAASPAPGDSQ